MAGIAEQHVHVWRHKTSVVPVRSYIKEEGKLTADLITGKDTLKQWACKCGAVSTYDLARFKR